MIHIERFINQLMSSNCYLVVDEATGYCLCIDPASEKSEREIEYISDNRLILDYILLTHEHIDHTWGVNALLEAFPTAKVVCSELCKGTFPKDAKVFFQLFYNVTNYEYVIKRIDYTTEFLGGKLKWHGHEVKFIDTPGHSPGSVCIAIDGMLFGGDTLILFKPFINKRKGGSKEQFAESITTIQRLFTPNTKVYPGHGEPFELHEIKESYKYFKIE